MNAYIKGRYYEYKIKKFLEKHGYIVFRSAGSHGLFDLIAIHPITKNILFIQVKKSRKTDNNIKQLKEIFKFFGRQANVYFQIWYKKGKKFELENII